MVTSAWDDSITPDEFEHVTAGYSYLKTGNGWLNVYHPPLFKDIAALPLMFAHLNDPFKMTCWQEHQKSRVIENFFFELGNDPQTIIRLARLPMILGALLFLAYYYIRIRREYGEAIGLTSLVLLGASPTFIAHSRFVHSDVVATAFFFISICSFVQFLKMPSRSSFFAAALCTGVALLAKASLLVLLPFYAVLSLVWVLISYDQDQRRKFLTTIWGRYVRCVASILAMAAIAMIVVMAYYQAHVQNLSQEFQHSYNVQCFAGKSNTLAPLVVTALDQSELTRGLSWYLTGVVAQAIHIGYGGHEQPSNLLDHYYFGGTPLYFPVLFLTKEPISSLAMIALALCVSACFWWKNRKSLNVIVLAREHFLAVAAILFVLFYSGIAVAVQLNIGFRHFIPVIPFLYMTAALIVIRGISSLTEQRSHLRLLAKGLPVVTLLSALLAWPGYLSYYNELAGARGQGYLIALDSNFDWGVDLLRLKKYLLAHGEKVVYMCYYDYGWDKNYMGDIAKPVSFERKFAPGQLIAVPVSRWRKLVQDSRADAIDIRQTQFPKIEDPAILRWFSSLKPIGKAGESIMLFRAPS
jgi:4-amino-4-deoxy-L-arabinose transferase-like glycosyltransferase